MLLYTGLRLAELVALDLGDVRVSARKGLVVVRSGKGGTGRRLSKRSVDDVVRGLGENAGVKLSAHILRHTFLTRMVRQGSDLVLVAELAGPWRLEATRRYSLPSEADRLLAVESIQIDF
jgi:site-specific recombinase XerD